MSKFNASALPTEPIHKDTKGGKKVRQSKPDPVNNGSTELMNSSSITREDPRKARRREQDALAVDVVKNHKEGKSTRVLGTEHGMGHTAVQELIARSSNSPEVIQVKRGLKNSMFKVAGMCTLGIEQRMEAGEQIPLASSAVIAGIMTQRAMELDKEPEPEQEPSWMDALGLPDDVKATQTILPVDETPSV